MTTPDNTPKTAEALEAERAGAITESMAADEGYPD